MRSPKYSDIRWMAEAYADWDQIHGDHAPITIDDVKRWVDRWIHRDDETCLVFETDASPVGLITYRQNMFSATIDNIVVHPNQRRKGFANAMIKEITQHLFDQGVLVATFKTLPGPIRDKYPDGVVTAWS